MESIKVQGRTRDEKIIDTLFVGLIFATVGTAYVLGAKAPNSDKAIARGGLVGWIGHRIHNG